MKIFITDQDINKGVKESCSRCPAGLALNREFPNRNVQVYEDQIVFYYPLKIVRSPFELKTFIRRFERDLSVGPMSFNL